jgi:hypothetical protein
VARAFQAARQRGQLHSNLTRDLGAGTRRVQRHRVEPQCAQPLAHGLVVQVVQADAVAA